MQDPFVVFIFLSFRGTLFCEVEVARVPPVCRERSLHSECRFVDLRILLCAGTSSSGWRPSRPGWCPHAEALALVYGSMLRSVLCVDVGFKGSWFRPVRFEVIIYGFMLRSVLCVVVVLKGSWLRHTRFKVIVFRGYSVVP